MPKQLRVGMISWAHAHVEFRAKHPKEEPGARIVAVTDDNEVRGRAAAERFEADQFVLDWRALVRRNDIDVVMARPAAISTSPKPLATNLSTDRARSAASLVGYRPSPGRNGEAKFQRLFVSHTEAQNFD